MIACIVFVIGGATVWPYAGVSVFPEKGSGLYWHNFDRTGQLDVLSLHQACPVILGNKWIGTKGVRFTPQWNRDKGRCGLSKAKNIFPNF